MELPDYDPAKQGLKPISCTALSWATIFFQTTIQQNKDWNLSSSVLPHFAYSFQTTIQQNKDWNKRFHLCMKRDLLFQTTIQQNKDWNSILILNPTTKEHFQTTIQQNKDWNRKFHLRAWELMQTSRLRSSKTRIETSHHWRDEIQLEPFQTTIQQNKDWNSLALIESGKKITLPDYDPAKQGLKQKSELCKN